jgi:thiol-disulfide isomerase/thioredoxin
MSETKSKTSTRSSKSGRDSSKKTSKPVTNTPKDREKGAPREKEPREKEPREKEPREKETSTPKKETPTPKKETPTPKKEVAKEKETPEKEVSENKVIVVKNVEEYASLRNNGLVVVDFNTSWCGPCRIFAPIFEEMAKNNPDVVFLSVDAEAIEHEDSASVSSVPTFKIFLNGVLKREFSGIDRDKLQRYIERYEIQVLFNGRVQRSFPKEKREKLIRYMDMLSNDK